MFEEVRRINRWSPFFLTWFRLWKLNKSHVLSGSAEWDSGTPDGIGIPWSPSESWSPESVVSPLEQCLCLDFLLRVLLSCSDWLSACVAIERAVTTVQGVTFDKAKSKRAAKWVILLVVLFTAGTHIHDPLHSVLVDDEEESRTFCIAQYTPSVQVFDRVINALHFFVPFAVNCFCALIIIIAAGRRRSQVHKKQGFEESLREQIKQHKHLLISPTILAILAVPRLIISFLSECMKSPRNASLYLIGCFISFAPAMLTFVVFVVPSEVYKKAFIESIQRLQTRIARSPLFTAFTRARWSSQTSRTSHSYCWCPWRGSFPQWHRTSTTATIRLS